MCDIHALNILPSQAAIDCIATYRCEFDKDAFDYPKLLVELKTAFYELNFMGQHDTTNWMRSRGKDYLSNPKLFDHAPLTYLCAFLGEIFKTYEVYELQEKIEPQILESALTRLEEFRLH